MGTAEELEFWKNEAARYKTERDRKMQSVFSFEAVSQEFSEYEQSSKSLEEEMEKQLDVQERQIGDLKSVNERLARENELIREKLHMVQEESRKQISRLEDELERASGQRDEYQKHIRDLEQTNDNLERSERNAQAYYEDLEKKVNEYIEKNAILESELDEKESLRISIQRLKDQISEQRQELLAQQQSNQQQKRTSLSGSVVSSSSEVSRVVEQRNLSPKPRENSTVSMDTTPTPATPHSHLRSGIPRSVTIDGSSLNGTATPLTPSGRISALNIVGDLLRKVGALETRLASCRKYSSSMKEEGSPRGPPNAKQPHLMEVPPSRLPKYSPKTKS